MRCILGYLKSNHSLHQEGAIFNFVSSDDISKIITSLDSTKRTNGVIPTKIFKLANKEICKDLVNCINKSIKRN